MKPPAFVDERWIAAAFADTVTRTDAMNEALQFSEELLRELESVDALIVGSPVYNFGLPAALKAYFDQILRVGRSFAYEPSEEFPDRPLLQSKPVIAIVAASDAAMHPGGRDADKNVLEVHLKTMLEHIGMGDVSFVRVAEDSDSEPHPWSLAAAERTSERLAEELSLRILRHSKRIG